MSEHPHALSHEKKDNEWAITNHTQFMFMNLCGMRCKYQHAKRKTT